MKLPHTRVPVKENGATRAEWVELYKSIFTFGGHGLWLTLAVIATASLIEGFGLVMLLPMAGLLFLTEGAVQKNPI